MEFELLTKILAGGGGATAAIYFIYSMIARIEKMHNEGMTKLDKAIDTVNNLTTTLAVHAKELEHGEKRFLKIEEELTLLRKTNHDFRNSLHEIKNKMVTQEHLKILMEK